MYIIIYMFKYAPQDLCESLFKFYWFFKLCFITFTVLEQLAVLNVTQDHLELKINWEKSGKQPVDFNNFKVCIFLFYPFFFSYMVFKFLNMTCLCFFQFYKLFNLSIFPFFNAKLMDKYFALTIAFYLYK